MTQENQTLYFNQNVKASPSQVYYAFTNATALREWLCDVSQAVPRPGGRLYMSWNTGYYMAGEYTEVEPGKKVVFTWHGRNEPGTTQVQVSLAEQDGGTRVRLEHSGIGTGPDWKTAREEIQKGWENGLENLSSVLESGQDLRFVRRPMLGIMLSDFNAEIAKHMGLPVTSGVRIDGTIPGMGAEAAGLKSGDVIVGMAGFPVEDFSSLTRALQDHRAGDEVEVVFYRGGEKKTLPMKLSGRPLPEIPATPAELTGILKDLYAKQVNMLAEVFEGVKDEEASHAPEPGEWSAKEVVAHIILGERYNSYNFADLVGGHEPLFEDFAANSHEHTAAVVAAHPTVQELLDELKRQHTENLAFLNSLPQEFVQRKGTYWRLAYNLIQPDTHAELHLDQIRAAIASGKNR